MKKRYWFGVVVMFTVLVRGQESKIVRVEPNGIVIHNAAGVESVVKQPESKPAEAQELKLSDLSKEELEERLVHINNKVNRMGNEPENAERRKHYVKVQKEIMNRINDLKNQDK